MVTSERLSRENQRASYPRYFTTHEESEVVGDFVFGLGCFLFPFLLMSGQILIVSHSFECSHIHDECSEKGEGNRAERLRG